MSALGHWGEDCIIGTDAGICSMWLTEMTFPITYPDRRIVLYESVELDTLSIPQIAGRQNGISQNGGVY